MSSQPHQRNAELSGDLPAPEPNPRPTVDPANERTGQWNGVGSGTDGSIGGGDPGRDGPNPAFPDEPSETESSGHTHFLAKESDHSQSLRSKLVLALAIMLAVVVGIDEFVRQKVIAPEFANLERVAALKDTNRVLSAINTEVEFLAETAAWEAPRFRERINGGHDPADDIQGLGERVKWAAVIDSHGDWTWIADGGLSQAASSPQGTRQAQVFPGIRDRIATSISEQSDNVRGMTRGLDGELHLFAATPIQRQGFLDGADDAPLLRSEWSGVPNAFFVVGRKLDKDAKEELQRRTSVSFAINPVDTTAETRKTIQIDPTNESVLSVVWPLLGPTGDPLAELNVQLPRDVSSRSARTTAFARYLSLCGACLSLMLLLLLLQRIVIGRIETIREHTERIAQSGILSGEAAEPVLRVGGQDEIGQLARAFDRMRFRLGDAQRRLTDASHAAGMSLVADTVIHNVGNVLTNVNSLIETATRRVDSLRIEPLEKLADRLGSDDVDEALQRATPDYLHRLSKTLESDKDELAALLETLNDNVQHIHQVIRDQRRHANQPVRWEQLELRSVVEEAVKCSQARLTKDNVSVEFDANLDARMWSDRSLLLQILINIISNAGNATRDITSRQPKLTIDCICTKSCVHIRFRDNGCGMDAETLSRVFDAHFTTRQSGSGLGLHFCAIAMKRIGGSIRAESDGPDQGATFVVEVPLQKPSTANKPDTDSPEGPSGGETIAADEDARVLLPSAGTGSGATGSDGDD